MFRQLDKETLIKRIKKKKKRRESVYVREREREIMTEET
jgi:hypothetical protein